MSVTTNKIDNAALRRLVVKNGGSLSAIARKLGVSRQAVHERLQRAGLSDDAARLRFLGGGTGHRNVGDLRVVERQRVLDALKEHGSQRAAARALGVGRRVIQRAIIRYGIKVPKKTKKKTALADGATRETK